MPAALARSGPTASPRPRGAQLPWAVTASLETRTTVRTASQPPRPLRPSPMFPSLLDPSDLILDFCPLAYLAPGAVKRKPWTSLSSESVSCPQRSLSPVASLIQVSQWGLSLSPFKGRHFCFVLGPALGPEAREQAEPIPALDAKRC